MSQITALAPWPASLQHAQGDVAGAAGNVEQGIGNGAFRRREPGDKVAFPQPVQAARHQVVHQVVAARDLGKDLVHKALLGSHPRQGRSRSSPSRFAASGRSRSSDMRADNSARPKIRLLLQRNGASSALRYGRLVMPELPEVETVRRGLGARPGRQCVRARRAAAPRSALSAAQAFRREACGAEGRGARPARQISARPPR